jgi:hypothetical protein
MMEGFGKRLRQALEGKPRWSLRKFADALRAAKVSGVSLPAIYRYLNDDAVPSIEWAAAAVKVLDVNLSWLILNEGEARPQPLVAPTVTVYTPPPELQPGARELWPLVLERATAFFLEHNPAAAQDKVRKFADAMLEVVIMASSGLAVSARPLDWRRAQTLALLAIDQVIPEIERERFQAASTPAPTKRKSRRGGKGKAQ